MSCKFSRCKWEITFVYKFYHRSCSVNYSCEKAMFNHFSSRYFIRGYLAKYFEFNPSESIVREATEL